MELLCFLSIMAGGQSDLQMQPVQVRAASVLSAPHCLPADPAPCNPLCSSLPESLFALALRAPAAAAEQPCLRAGFSKPSKVVLTCLTNSPVSAKGLPPPRQQAPCLPNNTRPRAGSWPCKHPPPTHTPLALLYCLISSGFRHPSSSPCESLAKAGFHDS